MKTTRVLLLLAFFCLGSTGITAQETLDFQKQHLEALWGSWQGGHWFAMNELGYTLPLSQKMASGSFGLQIKIRTFGTWYFFSKESFDLEAGITYRLPGAPQGLNWDFGAGVSAQFRLSPDERNYAEISWAPVLFAQPSYRWNAFEMKAPAQIYLYSNGLQLRTPFQMGYSFGVGQFFVKGEWDWLYSWTNNLGEIRFKSFAGLGFDF